MPFPASGHEQPTLDALEAATRNQKPAAFIVEPLILGAGGMLMYRRWVLKEMKRICEAHDVLFIADEVMTGWGRTGTLFACEQAAYCPISPAIRRASRAARCRSPLRFAGVKFSMRISPKTAVVPSSIQARIRQIPIACAAANANLDLWQDPGVRTRVAAVAAMQEKAVAPLRGDERFKNVRRTGTITAFELEAHDAGYLAGIGPRLLSFFGNRNLLLRPLGNTIYVMPPYCVTQADLDEIYAAIKDAADVLSA